MVVVAAWGNVPPWRRPRELRGIGGMEEVTKTVEAPVQGSQANTQSHFEIKSAWKQSHSTASLDPKKLGHIWFGKQSLQ